MKAINMRSFRLTLPGRLVVVPYYPLGEEEIREIVKLKLRGIQERIRENHIAELTFDEGLVEALAGKCTEPERGAREIGSDLDADFPAGAVGEDFRADGAGGGV